MNGLSEINHILITLRDNSKNLKHEKFVKDLMVANIGVKFLPENYE